MVGQPAVPYVSAAGDAFAIGRAHGTTRAASLRAFLADSLTRLNQILPAPVSMDALVPAIRAYRAEIAAAAPELADEVRGLAQGAGISLDQATLLQIRREVMGYRVVRAMGDCTCYARAADGVLAQTVDLNGNLEDQLCVLRIARAGSPRRVLLISFGGLLGYLGLNSDGLAIGLTLVLGGKWHPGLPPYLAIRYLLDTSGTVADAIEALRELRLASSRTIVLCDSRTCAYVEILEGELHITETDQVVHTNHYLDPGFASSDEINVFARNSSVRRLQACRSRLARIPAGAGTEDHFALLSEGPINVPGNGNIRREHTVAAVVMMPRAGELHLRSGDPALTATQVFVV
jgi:isopenicillin-N N-acyltransferase-like protein